MQTPKGIKKIIRLYRDRIADKVEGWIDWENPLGCGSFGCVFQIWSKDVAWDEPGDQARPLDRVLKISTDPTEGPVVSAIMKTGLDQRMTGLARWYGVWRIPERIQTGSRGTGWVIVREAVEPLKVLEIHRKTWGFPPWMEVLKDYNQNMGKSLKAKRPDRKRWFHEEAQKYLAELWNWQETYFIADAVEALARVDIILADIHHGNLGFRLHGTEEQPTQEVVWYDKKRRPPLLIFDPGHSSAPADTTVEDLWALSAVANPWMGGERLEIASL